MDEPKHHIQDENPSGQIARVTETTSRIMENISYVFEDEITNRLMDLAGLDGDITTYSFLQFAIYRNRQKCSTKDRQKCFTIDYLRKFLSQSFSPRFKFRPGLILNFLKGKFNVKMK